MPHQAQSSTTNPTLPTPDTIKPVPQVTQQTELNAILASAAIIPLEGPNARAFLRITGPDATRWLNGMVTNNIKDLAPGHGNYNFLLNNQGRIQGDCTIYRDTNSSEAVFILVTDQSQLGSIQTLLEKFIIMDDVELSEAHYWRQPLLLMGPKAAEVLSKIEKPFLTYDVTHSDLTPLQVAFYELTAIPIFTPSVGLVPRFEVSGEYRDDLIEGALEAGAIQVSAETLEAFRILEARPKYGTDIRNTDTAKDLPQETNQTHALHFSKGCYVGQEIVERIHSRGQVHRTFAAFTLSGPIPPLPAPLTLDGKPIGELTSAALVDGHALALGYARREALTHPLTYAGGTATQRQPGSLT